MREVRIATVAEDFEATLSFYRDALQLQVASTWDDPDGRGAVFRVNDLGLEVLEANKHHPFVAPAGVTVAIERDDVDALYERLEPMGFQFESPIADRPWGERSFTILAPNGLAISMFVALTEPS